MIESTAITATTIKAIPNELVTLEYASFVEDDVDVLEDEDELPLPLPLLLLLLLLLLLPLLLPLL